MNKDKILAACDAEEELEGQMPEEVWRQMQTKADALAFLRRIVRLTKKGIKNRIFRLFEEDKPEVWVIVQDTNVTHGQGDFEVEPMLAHKDYNPNDVFPAFTSVVAATAFKNSLTFKSMMRVQRLELKES